MENESFSFSRYDNRPLRFLWQDDSFAPLISNILPKLAQQDFWPKDRIVKSLFPKGGSTEQQAKMLSYIWKTIKIHQEDLSLVRMLFKAVRRSLPEHLMSTLALIFEIYPDNPDQLFEHLSLFPSSRTTGSSWIPVYESDKKVWEQVIQTIDNQPTQTFALLNYHQYAIRQIGYLNQQIVEEAARNFADPY